ncbi:hypothetical protein TNCT_374171 [Trichonephila clavata]|uniref:Uncharacterized protein n=1 Tax=Trichonephila clavata TaxID=2740835 RepID=A0A8X6GZC9_TRICU|nr:hypothetical protein TNCT_374171 [Trichonephila clavata]
MGSPFLRTAANQNAKSRGGRCSLHRLVLHAAPIVRINLLPNKFGTVKAGFPGQNLVNIYFNLKDIIRDFSLFRAQAKQLSLIIFKSFKLGT